MKIIDIVYVKEFNEIHWPCSVAFDKCVKEKRNIPALVTRGGHGELRCCGVDVFSMR